MTCQHCLDTGKTIGSQYLDCGYCDTARERADLEQWVHYQRMTNPDFDPIWDVYQKGKAVGSLK